MPLSAGRLRRRVTIRRKFTAPDGAGGQIETWQDAFTVWAEAISQNGREAVIAGALQGVASWRITMRWRADVGTADQLRLDGKDLNIRACDDPDGRREQLVIFADTASVER
jgi:SPP1 family predicted phage head-tail adaptor